MSLVLCEFSYACQPSRATLCEIAVSSMYKATMMLKHPRMCSCGCKGTVLWRGKVREVQIFSETRHDTYSSRCSKADTARVISTPTRLLAALFCSHHFLSLGVNFSAAALRPITYAGFAHCVEEHTAIL
jgi:hypothetical protein